MPCQCAPGRARPTTPQATPQDSESDRIFQYSRSYSGPAVKRWTLQDIVIVRGYAPIRRTPARRSGGTPGHAPEHLYRYRMEPEVPSARGHVGDVLRAAALALLGRQMGEAAIEDDEPQAVFLTERAKKLERLALRLAKSDANDSSAIAQPREGSAASGCPSPH